MVSLAQLWLPILLSAVVVFLVSGVLHMALKFWHIKDNKGFSNEDEVAATIRKGASQAGIYMLPYCTMENANSPEVRQKLADGPVGVMFLRSAGAPGMGGTLAQWFVFTLIVSLFVAYVAGATLPATVEGMQVFRVVGAVTFMAYAFGVVPYGIWWGQPWNTVFKDVIDGLIYGLVTGGIFAWLWPAAGG